MADGQVMKRMLPSVNTTDDSIVVYKSSDGIVQLDVQLADETVWLTLNPQYPPVEVKICDTIHDRFLIIDNEVYHLGASMKDLGKKLFAFSKLEMPVETLLKMTVMEEVENRKLQK